MSAAKNVTATFVLTVTNGVCGSANAQSFAIAPATNLCSAGTSSSVTGSGPWSWTCTGNNGGTSASASCSANIQTYTTTATVSGDYGTVTCTSPVNSGTTSTCTVTPSTGYQLATFTDNSVDKKSSVTGGSYSIANVTTNHTIAATFSLIPPTPVNGSCGTSNNGTFSIAPATNLCSAGTSTTVTNSGTGPWKWLCNGTNGGNVDSCAANNQQAASNSKCGDCNNDGVVGISEVQKTINNFLGL